MECRVFHHDHCFDGACSAAIFTRFHRECIGTVSDFSYFGLMHKAGPAFDEALFIGDENAIVDFKYSNSPKITWWFDHHQSAFMTPADHEHFVAGQVDWPGPVAHGGKFFDEHYISCTSLIADVARDKFGFDTAPLADLIHWADIIDGAKYASAREAIEMPAPAMKLTMAIESSGEGFVPRIIPLLTEMPLQQVLDQPFVQEALGPLMQRHLQAIELLRERTSVERGVVTFDITDSVTPGYSKFIPYYLHSEATYGVGLSRTKNGYKIGVGTSPWTTTPATQLANIADICQRYGGGGHARVGAISLSSDSEDAARNAAAEVAAELRGYDI